MQASAHIPSDQAPSGASGDARVPASSWLTLLMLTLTYAVYTLDKYIVAVVIEPIKGEFHLSDSQIAMFTGLAGTLPFLVTCIPLSMLADRMNRKWLLVILVVCWSGFTAVGGFATSMMFLTMARIGVTALEAGYTPLSMSIMTDKFPPRRRPTAMGIFNLGSQLGIFFGLAMGGLVVAAYGWRWAFFMAGVPGLIMGLAIALFLRDPPRGAYDPVEKQGMISTERWRITEALIVLWRTPLAFYGSLGLLLCSALPAAVGIWMPSFLIRVHHLSVQQAGFAAAAIGLVGAVGAASGGVTADWIGRKDEWKKFYAPIFGSVSAVIAGIIGLLLVSDTTLAVVFLAIMIFCHAFYAGVGYAVTLGNTPPLLRSTVIAIVLVATNVLASGLGNLVVGFVSDAMEPFAGTHSLTYGMASILIFSSIGALIFWRGMVIARGASRA